MKLYEIMFYKCVSDTLFNIPKNMAIAVLKPKQCE